MRRRTFLAGLLATITMAASSATAAVRSAVVEVCSKLRPRRRGMVLPPLPKWNNKTDDIDSADFARCALDYERDLLPKDVIFPQVGQVWVAVRDCEVNIQAWRQTSATQVWLPLWAGPFGKGFQGPMVPGKLRLQQGEKVRVQALDDPTRPLCVTLVPLRYDALHPLIVPDPQLRRWSRYVLSIRSAYTPCCAREESGFFHELFRVAEDVHES